MVKKSRIGDVGIYSEEAHKKLKILYLSSVTTDVITEFRYMYLLM